jgi:hypothetical protein
VEQVALTRMHHLRHAGEAPEGVAVEDAVAVALKGGSALAGRLSVAFV